MKVLDRVYGEITINHPLILKLIETQSFQRLRGINQYGGVNLVYPERYQVSRFEHSLGVWNILHRLNLPLEVQIAGLLHDIGHTAFSHMVDQAMERETEDFHEDHLNLIPGYDEVLALLKEAKIHLRPVDQYPTIKTPLPAVGADRLDYALRDFIGATNEKTDLGSRVLENLVVHGGKIHFRDLSIAAEFADTGLKAMWEVIYAPEVAVVYQALTEILREGLRAQWLTPPILYQNDAFVLEVIKQHRDSLPKKHLAILEQSFTVSEISDHAEADFIHIKKKIRVFDPPVLVNGQALPVSQLSTPFLDRQKAFLKKCADRQNGKAYRVEFGVE